MPRGGLLAKIAIVSGALSALMLALIYSEKNMRASSRAKALVASKKMVEGKSEDGARREMTEENSLRRAGISHIISAFVFWRRELRTPGGPTLLLDHHQLIGRRPPPLPPSPSAPFLLSL